MDKAPDAVLPRARPSPGLTAALASGQQIWDEVVRWWPALADEIVAGTLLLNERDAAPT